MEFDSHRKDLEKIIQDVKNKIDKSNVDVIQK